MATQFTQKIPEIKQKLEWVYDAKDRSRKWRGQSWIDNEMTDGKQWSNEDLEIARKLGVDPITINKTFSTINSMRGIRAISKSRIEAKARTAKDSENSQTLTECMAFIFDQNNGHLPRNRAKDCAFVGGIGCLQVKLNDNPFKEEIEVVYRDWKDVFWDPFGSVDFDPKDCKYVFYSPWMDTDSLVALYPEKEKEIREKCQYLEGKNRDYTEDDESSYVESEKAGDLSFWISTNRKRIRPVEMWYSVWGEGLFAKFNDGLTIEITEDMPESEAINVVQQAREVVRTSIRRIRVSTFLEDLLLSDIPSPFPFNEFPFISYTAYTDRYGYPYGVARNIRNQDIEINRRRTKALAKLDSKHVIIGEDAASGFMDMTQLVEQAKAPKGVLIAKDISQIKIDDHSDLSQPQINLLQQDEREIHEISGSNAEQQGIRSNTVSGVAIERRLQQSNIMSASIFENFQASDRKLGKFIVAMMQKFWPDEKPVRITDRLTGIEKFVVVNERKEDGTYVNLITQGIYDIVVSEAPMSDTVREGYLNLIMEWIKKSPPEVIPHLMNLALEMSNLPNKEQLLMKLKPILGIDPTEEDLTAEQQKEKLLKQMEAERQQAEQAAQIEQERISLGLEKMSLENQKMLVDIQKVMTDIKTQYLGAIKTGAETQASIDAQMDNQVNRITAGMAEGRETRENGSYVNRHARESGSF